ncbi:conserved hypothetical protein [Microcystis aeruginosa PCC 9807]|uniref:Uncharacterized protein n=1 Tax=Microcystis aeruginosa PCC 9807 TaxID=1160283 RepID=I4HDR9_MICAE|nr:conserved hypothetical protein [Microcystis aeruginosa PCC 9807]
MKLRVSYEKLTFCSENKEVKFMGMPCEVNSVLKLKPSQGYPESLELSKQYQGSKEDYRIFLLMFPFLC